jgi:LysR family glycine cleavage system transcriptional activator
MARRIAPLNALRAFEAAARHLSFTKAAEELHVTPAAISHQIKTLEEYCGAPLFRRLTRSLLLTDQGQAALPVLREGFDMLAAASQQMARTLEDHVLTVSAAPSIAAKWLVTRLERFRLKHPEIDVRLDTSDRLTDFARDGVDMVIRYGAGNYPGLHAEPLFPTAVFPVCSPELLKGPRPLKEPNDLANHTLLHVDWSSQTVTWPVWRMWLLAAGAEGVDPERGPRFNRDRGAGRGAGRRRAGGRRPGGRAVGAPLRTLGASRFRLSHRLPGGKCGCPKGSGFRRLAA